MAIKANNFFNLEEEVRTQGTLGGKPLSKEERKEAFKKQGTIGFKKFVQKVFNKKEAASSGVPKFKLQNPDISKIFDSTAPEETPKSEVAERVANAFDSRLDDLLKNIREDVGGILAVVEKQVDIDEEEAKDAKTDLEKNKRKEKEEKGEKQKKKGKASFLDPIIKPVKGLWESIVGGFMKLLAGWGITQFLKWFGDPKNAANVQAFKEFVVSAVPVVIKGILALIALDIGLKVLGFVKLIALGSVKLLAGLKGLFLSTIGAIKANPYMALAFAGVAAIAAGAAWAHNRSQQEAQQQQEEGQGPGEGFSPVKARPRLGRFTGDGFTKDITGSVESVPEDVAPPGHFNEGGFVSGPEGRDKVPAKLTAGEFVMSKGAVKEYGVDTLAGLNAAAGGTNRPKGNKFEGGGLVGDTSKLPQQSKGPSSGGFGMTAKEGFIGSDAKENRFTGPKKEAYFLQVKKKTGEIEIWNEEWGSDKFIGSMDPNSKKIDWNTMWWGGAKDWEKSYFSQPKNKEMVLSKAHALIKKSSAAGEINTKKANQLINNPPGKQKKGKVVPVGAGGGQGAGGGGGGQGQGQDVGLFSPIDTNNHYLSLVAAMCNIVSEDV